MSDERQRMIAGEPYRPGDATLVADRAAAQRFLRAYNTSTVEDGACRRPLSAAHLGALGERVAVRTPFYLDYGYNVFLGDESFLNVGCVLLDICPILPSSDGRLDSDMIAPEVTGGTTEEERRDSGEENAQAVLASVP